jgi:hypothetical protein
MPKLLAVAAVAAAVLAACDKQAESIAAPQPASGSAAEARAPQPKPHAPRPTDPANRGVGSARGSMPDFKPRTAFVTHAAQVLKVSPDDIEGGAIDAASASASPDNVGNAWAYVVWAQGDRDREVRGWVTADGTVITPEQNLGRLLAEAGLWTKPMPRSVDDMADLIAERLIWAYGPHKGHALVTARMNRMAPPELKVAPDGSGTLRFFSSQRPSGPGGAGGGPLTYTQNDLAFKADHKATLTKTPFTP